MAGLDGGDLGFCEAGVAVVAIRATKLLRIECGFASRIAADDAVGDAIERVAGVEHRFVQRLHLGGTELAVAHQGNPIARPGDT